MKWHNSLFEPAEQDTAKIMVQPEKVVPKGCTEETQSQSGLLQVTTGTTKKQQYREKVCEVKSQGEDIGTDPQESVKHDAQAVSYMEEVRREAAEARAKHEAWKVTLRPAPEHTVSPLLEVEEQHLKHFIASKLIVAPRRGDTFYHMSGSDLWWLQGQYEKETGYVFRMRPDFLSWHIAQVTGAKVMVDPQGQEWLIGVSYC